MSHVKIRALLIALLLLAPLLPAYAATPPKAGAICSKAGITKNYDGKKYTCIKSGKKLVWNKGVLIKSADHFPSPTKSLMPSPSPSQIPTPSPSQTPAPSLSKTPSPSATPTNTSTSIEDTGRIPDFKEVSVISTGETTADFSFKAIDYLSYRYFVVILSDSSGKEFESSPIINGSSESITLKIQNLECDRPNYYEARVIIFSGRDGKGNSRTGGAKISSTGKCATPRPKFTDTYLAPSRDSISLDNCKVKETSSIRKLIATSRTGNEILETISGFPLTQTRLPAKGTIRIIAIPVDWSDVPGEANFLDKWKTQFRTFSEWANLVSEGNLKIDWAIHEKWIRLPGAATSYSVPFSEAIPQSGDFWKKAIVVIDPVIDFTNYQIAAFILPSGQTVVQESIQELYPYNAIKDYPPKEGKLFAYMGAGTYFENWNVELWTYLAHEIGHMIDFAHGGSARDSGEMGGYDVMFSQDGPLRTFSGWWRFLANWFEQKQVFCDSLENFRDVNLSLVPLDSKEDGIKIAMIRISTSKILIVESRRFSKFDNPKRQAYFLRDISPDDWNGVFAYIYDANLGHLQNFFTPIASNQALTEYNWDGRTRYITRTSEVIEYEGLQIAVLKSGNFDSINIRKLSSSEQNTPRPKPSPAPSPTVDDFDVAPYVGGGARRTGDTTAVSTWYGQNFRSFRLYVVPLSNPSSTPLFDTGIINHFSSPVVVRMDKLTCTRDLVEIAIFYSGLNGKGKTTRIEQSAALSAVNIDGAGKCQGYWTNGNTGVG